MSTKVESSEYRFDAIKWFFVVAVVAVGIVGNSMYSASPLLYRVLALLGLAVVALLISYNTAKGNALWSLLQAAVVEIRKVVWPTRQEVNQTTLIVLVVVVIMAMILWGLDTLFGWIASLIIG